MSLATTDLPRVSGDTSDTPLRFVTAASLFDGHDAAINIMRRLIQALGAEVIHLGHNRSVDDIVRAAIQEDADAIAISSYQGGHMEFFRYMIDRLAELGASHIRVFGGGGGTITPEEIDELMAYGVERIYHPNDGMSMGLTEMIEDLYKRTLAARKPTSPPDDARFDQTVDIASMMSALEEDVYDDAALETMRKEWHVKAGRVPVVGITGTGGAGKSSVTDEILNRFLSCFPDMRIAVLAVDPTRRRTGGALLGDRIRMNSLRSERIYMRSIATRRQHLATSKMLADQIQFLKSLG
ncbi:MAG: cobalamin-dependent protein, partial [Woeseia sp.]